jgi:hypothetical protein
MQHNSTHHPSKKRLINGLRWMAVSANLLFALWILYNGINEGFEGTLPEKASYISLIGLLCFNAYLLLTQKKYKL